MTEFRRGMRVTYRYAGGRIVQGKIIRPYSADMPMWYLVELTDEQGTYRGGCHAEQLERKDNRKAAR